MGSADRPLLQACGHVSVPKECHLRGSHGLPRQPARLCPQHAPSLPSPGAGPPLRHHPGTVVSGQRQCQDPLLFPSHHRPLKHNKHPVWSGPWCPAELSLPASPACALDPAPQEKVRLPQTVAGLTGRGLHERTVLPGAQLAAIESLPQEPPSPHPH